MSARGELDKGAGEVLQRALDHVTTGERDLLVDLHGIAAMDVDGLLNLLNLHRRADRMRLRVLVTGWQPQPQPQQCMATVAGIPGPRSATGDTLWAIHAGKHAGPDMPQLREYVRTAYQTWLNNHPVADPLTPGDWW
ncbi:STAS domain-containing protein [Streptomyces sp. NPDC086989]|uniref:STAS domain-containing protein n=1 Tax=Streptomyces sp. NPDC086989 TaxID=3365764 RepID=UPI0037F39A0D